MQTLRRIVRTLLGLLLLSMVLLNVANAAGRYLLGKAIPGSDELLVFAMIWLVFLGAVVVTAQGGHLAFDVLSRALPPAPRRALYVLQCLGVAALTGFAATQSWAVLRKLARVDQSSMAIGMPMVVPHAAVLLGLSAVALLSLWLALRPRAPGHEHDDAGAP